MDASLKKEREAFLQRALKAAEGPTSSKKASTATGKPKKKKPVISRPKPVPLAQGSSVDEFRAAAQSGHRSNNPNRVLKAVMDMMGQRYSSKKYDPLTLEEILEALKLTQLSTEMRGWLLQALRTNPKIDHFPESETFLFKPSLGGGVRNRHQLLDLLKDYDHRGLGGVTMSEIREALPKPEKSVRRLSEEGYILRVVRSDREEVIFYNNPEYVLDEEVSEEFKSLWHRVSVEGLTEADIEKQLDSSGQRAMQGEGRKRKAPVSQQKRPSKKSRATKVLNTHLSNDIIKDYSDSVATQ